MSTDDTPLSKDLFEGFSFAPEWAREDPATQKVRFTKDAEHFDRSGRDDRGERRFGDRPRDRSERGERRFGGDRPRDRSERGERRFGGDRGERRFGDRPRFGGDRGERRFTPPPPPDFTVRFLPDQGALNVIGRKIATSGKAMALRDVVALFFKEPDSTLVCVEFDKEHPDARFHQCRTCGWFARSEEALRNHLIAAHFAEYFEPREKIVEAPTGNFPGVARCGITGKLLAPPNHHLYNRRIAEMLRGECAGMSEAEYRSRIELVNDPALVEQWKEECTHAQMWVRKAPAKPAAAPAPKAPAAEAAPAPEVPAAEASPEAPAAETAPEAPAAEATPEEVLLSREEAEEIFLREIAPKLGHHGRQATVSHKVSVQCPDADILAAVRRAWSHESEKSIGSLFFAVRGGLRSRKLAIFRADPARHEEFIARRAPKVLDASTATVEIRAILAYVAAHKGCSQDDVLAALPGETTRKQLDFLLDLGHLTDYAKGGLRLPEGAVAPEAPASAAPSTSADDAVAPMTPAPTEDAVAPMAPAPTEDAVAPMAPAPHDSEPESEAPVAPVETKEEESATPAVAEEFTKGAENPPAS